MEVKFSYLDRQFSEIDDYMSKLRGVVISGDFTLGDPVAEFEEKFAKICRMPYAVGVGSGTDAIILSLKALGVGPGDEVITTTNTFIATVGAIVMAGATPVLVDSEDGFVIEASKIEDVITDKTKAIIPVHYTGNVAEMETISQLAKEHSLFIVEDACQSIKAEIDGNPVGSWGETAAFSLHPLKNLNVWGDGGIITTRSEDMAKKLRLLRNHGLINRDEVEIFGGNSRLDTLQAVVGNLLIDKTEWITRKRIENANKYDEAFSGMENVIEIPKRRKGVRHVYHLYIVRVKKRDELLRNLNDRGVEAKIHYPIPVHLQKAAKYLGYKKGDFPKAESDADSIITLPAHQHLTEEEIDYTIETVKEFYTNNG